MAFRIERRLGRHGKGPGQQHFIRIGDGAPPTPTDPPVNTVLPVITGTPTVGQTLTVDTGSWDNDPTGFAYQWYRDAVAIAGATLNTYLLVWDDVGTDVHATVEASNDVGADTADAAAVEIAGVAPTNLTPPSYTGTVRVGQTVTAVTGTWAHADSLAYVWLRNGVSVGTGNTLNITAGMEGGNLVLRQNATNAYGTTPANSASQPILGNPPVNTVAPTITGDLKVGGSATLNLGTWTGADDVDFVWTLNGAPMIGVTSNPLSLASGFVAGDDLGAIVTGSNVWGDTNVTVPAVEIAPDTITPELAYVSAQNIATPSGTSFSFSVGSLGADHPKRLVVIYLGAWYNGSSTGITAVTINGVAAQFAALTSVNSSQTGMCGIAWAYVPTGTSATVNVTLAHTPNPSYGLGAAHWVGKVNSDTPVDNDIITGTAALHSLTLSGGDVAIWAGSSGGGLNLNSQVNSTNEGRLVSGASRFTYYGRITDVDALMSTTASSAAQYAIRGISWS